MAVKRLAFSPDGQTLASGGADGVGLWDVAAGRLRRHLSDALLGVTALGFTSGGQGLAVASPVAPPRQFDLKSGRYRQAVPGRDGNVHWLVCPPDGLPWIGGREDGSAIVWDPLAGKEIQRHRLHDRQPLRALAGSVNGRWLASAGADDTVHVWDAGRFTDEVVTPHKSVKAANVRSLAFHPDGHHLAVGDNDGGLRLVEVATGTGVVSRPGNSSGALLSLAFSPDGRLLAGGSADGTVWLWRADTAEVLFPQEGHKGEVREVSFSPDGRLLATAGLDGSIRVWHGYRDEAKPVKPVP